MTSDLLHDIRPYVSEVPFSTLAVKAAFDAFPDAIRPDLLRARAMILQVAKQVAVQIGHTGPVSETLKWGQPSYLFQEPKHGTTVRLGLRKDGRYGLYVPCSTTLITDFDAEFGADFHLDGKRGVVFAPGQDMQAAPLRLLVHRALTYGV